MTLGWQKMNETIFAEAFGRRYSVRCSLGLQEWTLKIDGVFHSRWPTRDAACQRAEVHAETYKQSERQRASQ